MVADGWKEVADGGWWLMGAERAKWAIFSLAVAARSLNSLPRLAASAYHMCAHHTIPQHTTAQHTTPYHPIPYHSMPHHTFTIPANKTTPQHTTPTILTCKQYHTITYLASPIYHTTKYHTSVYQTRPTSVHPDHCKTQLCTEALAGWLVPDLQGQKGWISPFHRSKKGSTPR